MAEVAEEALALLKLYLCKGVGTAAIHHLVQAFGSARAALAADRRELRTRAGLDEQVAETIARGPSGADVETELDLMERGQVRLVPFSSPDYPEPLKQLDPGAPPLLWTRGDYLPRDHLAVAIVGSRRCSHYGRAQARRFAMSLAQMGFTIVSGLARGIDCEAHRAALQAKGRTIGVLGCGLGQIEHLDEWELACRIPQSGALISELPMMSPPLPRNFPPRNRLISGLSLGTLVVEAGSRSGSLITARWAGEQGKSVFAVPGNVDSPTSHGCHQLIRDGAVLVEDPREVVEELGPLSQPVEAPASGQAEGEPGETIADPRLLALSEREREVYKSLTRTPRPIDEVTVETGLPVSIVSSILLTLEIRGLATQLPGQRYVRT